MSYIEAHMKKYVTIYHDAQNMEMLDFNTNTFRSAIFRFVRLSVMPLDRMGKHKVQSVKLMNSDWIPWRH